MIFLRLNLQTTSPRQVAQLIMAILKVFPQATMTVSHDGWMDFSTNARRSTSTSELPSSS